MMPTRKYNNQNWLPSIFNDFFDNEWLTRANATAPAIIVIESDKDYKESHFVSKWQLLFMSVYYLCIVL